MQEDIAKAITTADTMSPDGIQTRLEITVYDDRFTVKFKSGLAIDYSGRSAHALKRVQRMGIAV